MTPTVLYSYWRSSCSYRVRIALALKRVGYEYRAVHLLKDGGQQLAAEYAALNPMKVLPALAIDGVTLTQSHTIIEYLEETRPERSLLPKGPLERARVREICDVIGCDIQPVGNLRILKHIASLVSDPAEKDAAKAAWAKQYIVAGFEALEKLLIASAGRYCVGDEITMADVFLAPQVYNAMRFKVDLSAYPTISRVYAAAAELDEFKAAHPSVQPDAEPDAK